MLFTSSAREAVASRPPSIFASEPDVALDAHQRRAPAGGFPLESDGETDEE
jgi:hypothetical protein